MHSNGEKIINSGDIEICTESFGNPSDIPILLIMGATASMVHWDEEFCKKLASSGRFVIRFDNRDTGRSSSYDQGTINYNITDLVHDSFDVLDGYNLGSAHFAGISLGGMIAQLAALLSPLRVLTLTLISSSIWDDRPDLPATLDEVIKFHKKGASVDWTNKDQVINYLVEGARMMNGSTHKFDEKRSRELISLDISRANNLLSMFNHSLLAGGEEFYGKTGSLNHPSLIIHGTEDPVLPFQHALALKEELKNSRLFKLEGSGHEIHRNEWDRIIAEIIDHTS